MRVAFLGLGAMGIPMAANVAKAHETVVWNRTESVAQAHAQGHGTTVAALADLHAVDALITCLPVTATVVEIADRLRDVLTPGTLWIDATSGDPTASRTLAADLAGRGVRYVDAPVSGGTSGAEAGTLTTMVGGAAEDVEDARSILAAMARLIVHVGPVGAGHAVKAINNTLLAANLVTAVEGLLALKALGIDPSAAVEVLNHSSGRSFATEHPIPERIISGTFDNTFALGLLAKDVGLGVDVLDVAGDRAPALRAVADVVCDALAHAGAEVDHSALATAIEDAAGRTLR